MINRQDVIIPGPPVGKVRWWLFRVPLLSLLPPDLGVSKPSFLWGSRGFFISSKLHTVRVRQGEKHTFLGNAGKDGHHLGKESQKTDMVLRQLRIRKEDRWKDLESYFFTTAHAHRPRKVSYSARGVPPSR